MAHRSPSPFSIGVPVSARRVRAGIRRSCNGGLARRVLDRLSLVEHDRSPADRSQRFDVADRRGIGGDHDVRLGDLGFELRCGRPRGPVVDNDTQLGNEAGGFGGPVADDRSRSDHQGRAGRRRAGELGEHGRGLAEAHVEGEASAELGGVEEPDPGERLGLVGAELSGEPVGSGHRRCRRRAGPIDDVGGPAVAMHVDATSEPWPVEADAVAQDVRPGQLVGLFALGERSCGLFEVDPVDLDPAAAGLHERAGLPGELRHLGRGELHVVEENRPGDVAELVRSHHRAGRCLREQSERRSRPAARQRRCPHVEADSGEAGTVDGHELPRFVLAQRDLSPALRPRSVEGREEPSESRPLGGHRSAAPLGPQRGVNRDGPTLGRWCVDRQEPDPAGARRIELHDKPRTRRGRDGARPVLECPRHVSGERGGGSERCATHAGDQRVAHVPH